MKEKKNKKKCPLCLLTMQFFVMELYRKMFGDAIMCIQTLAWLRSFAQTLSFFLSPSLSSFFRPTLWSGSLALSSGGGGDCERVLRRLKFPSSTSTTAASVPIFIIPKTQLGDPGVYASASLPYTPAQWEFVIEAWKLNKDEVHRPWAFFSHF